MTTLTKDSEIAWIGKIPANWEVKRIKDVSKIKKGKAVETFLEKSEEMLPCIDTNFLRGRDNIVYCNNGIKISSDRVLILWDGANAGELFFNEHIGYLGSTFGIFNTKINNKFWFYYLKGIEQYSRDNLTGMGVPHVDGNVLKQTIALIPSKEQQTKIANYLDTETYKIDRKISILEQKYEKLEDYKQSVIFETVTKGLDANVPMKNSGIDWIGDIPAHWEVKRVKDVLNLKGGGVDKKIIEGEQLVNLVNFVDVFKKIPLNNEQKYMIVSCPSIKVKDVSLKKNDILITPSSETPKEIGLANIVLENLENTVFSYHIQRLRSIVSSLNPKYAYHYFNSKFAAFQFEGKAIGTTRVTLSRYDINSNIIFYPPKFEQDIIVNYIDETSSKINKKKEIIKKQIDLLKEYKQTIIYEAVTGKIVLGE